jgi:hypothetical protein
VVVFYSKPGRMESITSLTGDRFFKDFDIGLKMGQDIVVKPKNITTRNQSENF